MLSKAFSLLVLFIFGGTVSSAQVDSGAVTLRYNFEKGKTYRYMVETEAKVTQRIQRQENVSTINRTDVVRIDIHDVSDSMLTAFVSYESIFGELQTRQQRITIGGQGFTGKKVKWTITNLGKTITIAKVDTFAESQAIGDPISNFKQLVIPLPRKLLQVGDAWTQTEPDTINAMGSQFISVPDIEYKVTDYETKANYNCLKITYKGKVSFEGKGTMQGVTFSVTGESKPEGTVFFAPQEGVIVAQESTDDQETSTELSGPVYMLIPGTQTVKTNILLLKK